MGLFQVVLAVGRAGTSQSHVPTGTEGTSALLAILITAGVLAWGRRIARRQAEKIIPFPRG